MSLGVFSLLLFFGKSLRAGINSSLNVWPHGRNSTIQFTIFLCWLVITNSISFLLVCLSFVFHLDSILVHCMSLGIIQMLAYNCS